MPVRESLETYLKPSADAVELVSGDTYLSPQTNGESESKQSVCNFQVVKSGLNELPNDHQIES